MSPNKFIFNIRILRDMIKFNDHHEKIIINNIMIVVL